MGLSLPRYDFGCSALLRESLRRMHLSRQMRFSDWLHDIIQVRVELDGMGRRRPTAPRRCRPSARLEKASGHRPATAAGSS